MNKKLLPKISLKTSILLPLGVVLIVLILGFIYAYMHQEKIYTQKHIGDQFLSAKQALDTSIQTEKDKLSAILTSIVANPELKHTMMAGDRNTLLKQSEDFFNTLQDKYQITHFYFHGPDRVNFLRMHKPDRYGDMINRFSALQAELTGKPASALETGPLGLFTLRVVFPWYENNKLIGYVELGEEIEHIYSRIKNVLNIDLSVLIDKRILSRRDWEIGMNMLKRKAEWDLMPNSVIAYTTMSDNKKSVFTHFMGNSSRGEITVEIEKDEQIFIPYILPLVNEGEKNKEIGSMLFIRDVTDIKEYSKHNFLRIIWFGSGIGGILLLLFFLLTRRTEQKIESSKKALVKSEARFRTLVENSSDLIWEVDANGHYTYVSPKVKDLLGYEVSEVMGKTPFELMPEDEAERISEKFTAIVKERSPIVSTVNANRHKDGQIVFMETSGIPIIAKDGNLIGYRGIDRDITEWKQADDALKKVTERFVLHFEQSPLAIIEWDTDLKVTAWNPAAETTFGYTKAEAMGHSAEELILTENVKPDIDKVWASLFSNEGGYRHTNKNITKEGKHIICDWYNTPLIDKSGQVIGVISISEDVTEKKRYEERMTHMAYYNALTDLPNRFLLKDRLEQECRNADRYKYIVAVLYLDIDNFKNVNETLGYVIGDMLLKAVAERFKESLRKSDTVAHFSADEFAIIIPRLKEVDNIKYVLESTLEQFKQSFKILDHTLFVTLSMGYSFYPLDATDPDILLRNADTAMHQAKKLGYNQQIHYDSTMTDQATRHRTMHNGLIQALKKNEFVLYYQPQIDMKTGLMTGLEVLVRWQHPEDGIISPAEFIPVAEDTGLIIEVGEWVLRTACRQAKSWQDQGFTPLIMAVNLSSRQFKEKDFSKTVIKIIHETGLDPEYVELELTESILIEDGDLVYKALNDFKKAGIRLALDDFGTGYSSLSYLKRFPIDKLKIDRSFVTDVVRNQNDAALVRAMISMAWALGLRTIAEGVETKEQLEFLKSEGCEEIQGYLAGKPVPTEEIQNLLKNR